MNRFLLLACVLLAGCDADADDSGSGLLGRLIGTYAVVKFEDRAEAFAGMRDQTSQVICVPADSGPTPGSPCQVNSLRLTFKRDSTLTLAVDFTASKNAAGRADLQLPGFASELNEAAGSFWLTVPTMDTDERVTVAFESGGLVTLKMDERMWNFLFGSLAHQSGVRLTLQKQ